MKSNSSIQLSKAWWKKEQPAGLKSAGALEKALDEYAKHSAVLKGGADASAIKKFEASLDAIEQAAKQVISEAQGLEKKAKGADEKKDLKNTVDVMGKPLQRELAAARSALDDLDEDDDEEDVGNFGDVASHSKYVKKFAGKLKKNPFSFALAVPSNEPAEMRFAFHRKKAGRGLGGMLKKATGSRKFTFGTASSEALGSEGDEGSNRVLLLNLEGRRIPGLAKRVKVLLRALNVSAFGKVKLMIGGVEVESADETTDDTLEPLDLADETGDEEEEVTSEARENPEAPPQPPLSADQLTKVLAALVKRIAALAGDDARRLGATAREIQAMLRTGQLADAGEAIARLRGDVERAEQGTASDGGATGDPLAVWEGAKETADAGIAALQADLRRHGHPDLMRIAEYGLNGATEGNQVKLMRAIIAYNASTGPARVTAATQLAEQAAAYRAFLEGSALIRLCEKNPFGVAVSIRAPLSIALEKIERMASV